MPYRTAPKIELTARVRKILEEMARQRSTESRWVVRASLMLAMSDGAGNHAVVRTQNLERGTVRYWRARWIEMPPTLTSATASEISDEDLRAVVLTGLSDLPRRGTPPTCTAEQSVQILAVACEEPAKSERPSSHWTPAEVAAEVSKRKLVASISPASGARFLQSGRSQTAAD